MSDLPIGAVGRARHAADRAAAGRARARRILLEIKAGDLKELVGFRVTP